MARTPATPAPRRQHPNSTHLYITPLERAAIAFLKGKLAARSNSEVVKRAIRRLAAENGFQR